MIILKKRRKFQNKDQVFKVRKCSRITIIAMSFFFLVLRNTGHVGRHFQTISIEKKIKVCWNSTYVVFNYFITLYWTTYDYVFKRHLPFRRSFLPLAACQSPFLECLQSLPKGNAFASDILVSQSLETLKSHISLFHLVDPP